MTTSDHIPERGSNVELWLKYRRDLYKACRTAGQASTYWALDDMLDDYRLHADTGTPLDEEAHYE